jgi:hypothetical protein
MTPPKPLHVREAELVALLATPAGRTELEQLASRYAAADGRFRAPRTSVVTYIIVHERQAGLISD